jgi:hypothetical protein
LNERDNSFANEVKLFFFSLFLSVGEAELQGRAAELGGWPFRFFSFFQSFDQ